MTNDIYQNDPQNTRLSASGHSAYIQYKEPYNETQYNNTSKKKPTQTEHNDAQNDNTEHNDSQNNNTAVGYSE
jgi:hypothetical protein